MKLVVIFLSLTFNLIASASVKESVCSKTTTVCAAYETDVAFTTKQEGRFTLTLTSTDGKEVAFVKADLWMQMGQHGHGSSPLKITQVAPLQFDVTKAYFVMRGKWQILVTYTQDGKPETLILPAMIKE